MTAATLGGSDLLGKIRDITGQKFGRLLVIGEAGRAKSRHVKWLCQCECGKEFEAIGINLRNGSTTSCGCLKNEKTVERLTKHNGYHTATYRTWANMIQRCTNKNATAYKHYGGRGITVCAEWKNDFTTFLSYVSKLPHFNENGYSIDRIDVNGNYEPGNVRWATQSDQVRNRRPRQRSKTTGIGGNENG